MPFVKNNPKLVLNLEPNWESTVPNLSVPNLRIAHHNKATVCYSVFYLNCHTQPIPQYHLGAGYAHIPEPAFGYW